MRGTTVRAGRAGTPCSWTSGELVAPTGEVGPLGRVAGEVLFPRRYEEALTALLDRIVEQGGREAAVGLLEGRPGIHAITDDWAAELQRGMPEGARPNARRP